LRFKWAHSKSRRRVGRLHLWLAPANRFVDQSRPQFYFFDRAGAAASAAAAAGIRLIEAQEGEDRRAQLWAQVDKVKNALVAAKWRLPVVQSAIIPLLVGDETAAVNFAAALRENGIFIPAIRYPTVARAWRDCV